MPDQTVDESTLTTGTTSPFLPGTKVQYAWDSTSLGYIKTCPRLYQYVMLDGWTPRGESVHLRFGMEYHAALEQYDRLIAEGISREDAIRSVIHELLARVAEWNPDQSTKAGRYKNKGTLVSLVVDYLDHFDPDPAETYIKSDGTPAVELSFRFELDWGPEAGHQVTHESTGEPWVPQLEPGSVNYINLDGTGVKTTIYDQPYLLCGHLDRVVSFNDQLLVMDRKTTTTTLSGYYFNQYEPNNQMTLYTLAGKIIMGAPIRGVIIDGAQILLEKPNAFARGFTYRTEDQLEEWLVDLRVLLENAERYAENDYWPMNDSSCDKFGGCRYRDICSKSPSVRERFLAADFEKLDENARWNPMKPR
jgi:uncharacterized protein YoaH (UPF0181 family)